MAKSFNILMYLSMCIAALAIYTMQRLNMELPSLINNYVNDFLCLPILFGSISFVFRWLKKDNSFKFSLISILLMASYYSFYFEYYLPQFNSRYTADWIDIFLYFLSGLTFFFYEKHFEKPSKNFNSR